MAGKQKPNWHLSFDISPELTFTRDRQPCHKATVIARHGDLAFMAELELVNWSEDIAAFFSRARSVFTSGAPDFPDMTEEVSTAEPADSEEVMSEAEPADAPQEDTPVDETDELEEDSDAYEFTYYPAEGSAEEIDPAQSSLW
ncbi:MAG: hypothetical protein JXJ17_12040 [Anaerolineae bacterium]|nr:hypothetical protein [Anaerolineae bacterium]